MTNDIVKSRRGVYYKQDASPYRTSMYGLVFVFSSKARQQQWYKKRGAIIDKINKKLLSIHETLDQDINIIFLERSETPPHYERSSLYALASVKAYKEVEPEWQPLKANQNR